MRNWQAYLQKHPWIAEAAAALVPAALCLPLLVNFYLYLSPDSGLYLAEGVNLAQLQFYSKLGDAPDLLRPPLFAGLIALFFAVGGISLSSAFAAVKLMGLLSLAALYLYGERLWARGVGLVACFLVLTNNYLVGYLFGRVLLDGALTAFLLLTIVWVTLGAARRKKRYFALGGLCMAAAFMVKEGALTLVPLPALAWLLIAQWRQRRIFAGVAVFYLVAGVALLPWWIYVYLQSGAIYLLNSGRFRPLTSVPPGLVAGAALALAGALAAAVVLILLKRDWLFRLLQQHSVAAARLAAAAGYVLLSAYIFVASTPITLAMAQQYWAQYLDAILQKDPIFWLFLPAWIWVAWLGLWRRQMAAQVMLLAAALYVPLLTILIRWGNEPRNLLLVMLLSCLALGSAAVAALHWLLQQASQSSWGLLQRIMLAGVCLAGVLWGALLVRNSPIWNPALQQRADVESVGLKPSASCATWFAEHVPAGSNVGIGSIFDGEFYFRVRGSDYNFHSLDLQSVYVEPQQFFVYLQQQSALDPGTVAALAASPSRTPLSYQYHLLWEGELIDQIKSQEIGYIVLEAAPAVSGFAAAAAAYMANNPGFQLLCQSPATVRYPLSVYQVDRDALQETGVTYSDPATLSSILANTGGVTGDPAPAEPTPADNAGQIAVLDLLGRDIRLRGPDLSAAAAGHAVMSEIYRKAGRNTQAAEQLKWAAVLDSTQLPTEDLVQFAAAWQDSPGDDPWSLLAAANTWRQAQRTDAMNAAFLQVVDRAEQNLDFRWLLAQSLRAANLSDLSDGVIRQAAAQVAGNKEMTLALISLLYRLASGPLQVELLQQYLALAPDDQGMWWQLISALIAARRYDEARSTLAYLDQNRLAASVIQALWGEYYAATGDLAQARAAYSQVVKDAPDLAACLKLLTFVEAGVPADIGPCSQLPSPADQAVYSLKLGEYYLSLTQQPLPGFN